MSLSVPAAGETGEASKYAVKLAMCDNTSYLAHILVGEADMKIAREVPKARKKIRAEVPGVPEDARVGGAALLCPGSGPCGFQRMAARHSDLIAATIPI